METKNHNILVVEHNQKNAELISNALHKFGFICNSASDYAALDNALKKNDVFDIVLMDITGFDAEIWERCKKIHQMNIPLLYYRQNQVLPSSNMACAMAPGESYQNP